MPYSSYNDAISNQRKYYRQNRERILHRLKERRQLNKASSHHDKHSVASFCALFNKDDKVGECAVPASNGKGKTNEGGATHQQPLSHKDN